MDLVPGRPGANGDTEDEARGTGGGLGRQGLLDGWPRAPPPPRVLAS